MGSLESVMALWPISSAGMRTGNLAEGPWPFLLFDLPQLSLQIFDGALHFLRV